MDIVGTKVAKAPTYGQWLEEEMSWLAARPSGHTKEILVAGKKHKPVAPSRSQSSGEDSSWWEVAHEG